MAAGVYRRQVCPGTVSAVTRQRGRRGESEVVRGCGDPPGVDEIEALARGDELRGMRECVGEEVKGKERIPNGAYPEASASGVHTHIQHRCRRLRCTGMSTPSPRR